ncbi:MAG: hypothetical protein ACO1N0_06820 [Fluviicola sp.]
MKQINALFIGLSSLLLITSCSSDPEAKSADESVQQTSAGSDSLKKEEWFPETNFDTLRGLYTGDFGDGFINVVLTYVNEKKAIGYNVHKGLQRNISGSVVQKKEQFELTLNEPGDNPYDGIFVLTISKKDGSVNASWTANDPKIKSKKFTLKKRTLDSKNVSDEKDYFDFTSDKVTEENFREVFSHASLYIGDKSGDISFLENGIVKYSYYPDNQQNEQMEMIKGSWKFKDAKTLIIDWAKNNEFKARQMSFKLIQNTEEPPYFETKDGKNSINMFMY